MAFQDTVPRAHPPRGPDVLDRVYALHPFTAENADELAFRGGEWIDVVERDDEFGDGWWRGRVVAEGGAEQREGLFPASYVLPSGVDPTPFLEMQRGAGGEERGRELVNTTAATTAGKSPSRPNSIRSRSRASSLAPAPGAPEDGDDVPPLPVQGAAEGVDGQEKEESTGLRLDIPPVPVAATATEKDAANGKDATTGKDAATATTATSTPPPTTASAETVQHELGRRDEAAIGPAEKAAQVASHPDTQAGALNVKAEPNDDESDDDDDAGNAAQTRTRLAEAARVENERREAAAAAAAAAEQEKNLKAQSSPLFAGSGFVPATSLPGSTSHSRTGSTQFASSMTTGVRMSNGRTLLGSAAGNGLPAGLIYSDESDSEEEDDDDGDGVFDPRASSAARNVSGGKPASVTKSPKMSERDRRVFGDDLDDGGLLERVKGVASGATAGLGLGAAAGLGAAGLGAAGLMQSTSQRSSQNQPDTSRLATQPPSVATTASPSAAPATPPAMPTLPTAPIEPLRVPGSMSGPSGRSGSATPPPPQSTVEDEKAQNSTPEKDQRGSRDPTPTPPIAPLAPAAATSTQSPPSGAFLTLPSRQAAPAAMTAMSLSPPMVPEESPMGTPTPAAYGATAPLPAVPAVNGFSAVAQGMDEVDAGYAFPPIPVATSAAPPASDDKQRQTSLVPPVSVIEPAPPAALEESMPVETSAARDVARTPSPHAPSNAISPQHAAGVTSAPPTTVPAPMSPAHNVQADTTAPSSSGWAGVPGDPMVWTVDQVAAWAKGRGFDDAVCGKLIEHEITGDVLLEMDANTLKEIDIIQFGKRVKIANAINELRRPGSMRSVGNASTRSQQLSPGYGSHHRVPSLGGIGYPMPGFPTSPIYDNPQPQHSRATSMSGVVDTIPENGTYEPQQRQADTTALGFNQLTTSSTSSPGAAHPNYAEWDTSRKSSMSAIQQEPRSHAPIHEEDESSHTVIALTPELPLSANVGSAVSQPTTAVASSMHGTASVHSKSSSIPPTPTTPSTRRGSVENRPSSAFGHRKARSSMDGSSTTGRAASERVSNLLSGALTRNRKPAPRYPSSASAQNLDQIANDGTGDRRSISRLMGGHSKKDSKGTPSAMTKASTTNPQRISVGTPIPTSPNNRNGPLAANDAAGTALSKIGTPDFSGFLKKKGDRYNTWKTRYFVLKGPRLYYLRNEKEQKLKGHIDLGGYKVMTDANTSSGNYGFQLVHDREKTHHFSSSDHRAIKEWMKNLMKATITRDFTAPVISSCNIHTIPLREAQALAPRPPSPTSMQATQRAARRDNPNQLTARDASVLMEFDKEKGKHMSLSPTTAHMDSRTAVSGLGYGAPPRPSREMRRPSAIDKARSGSLASYYPDEEAPAVMASPVPVPSIPKQFLSAPSTAGESQPAAKSVTNASDPRQAELIRWINLNLPATTEKATSIPGSFVSGKLVCRVIENIAGPDAATASQVVTDAMFESTTGEPNLEGIFSAFDKCIDENVDINGVSINDIRLGDADRITQLLENLRTWGEQRKLQAL